MWVEVEDVVEATVVTQWLLLPGRLLPSPTMSVESVEICRGMPNNVPKNCRGCL